MNSYHHYIIVGSGVGGLTTAKSLVENDRNGILILEEGDCNELNHKKRGTAKDIERNYRHGGINAFLSNPSIAFAEACTVGGGPEVNTGFAHGIPDEVITEWRKDFKIINFNKQSLDHYFQRFNQFANIGPCESKTQLDSDLYKSKKLFARRDSKRTLLTELKDNKNWNHIKIKNNSKVIKILKKDNLIEVHCQQGVVYRCKKLVLASGTIQTFLILKNSFKIKGLGKSFYCHPFIKVLVKFEDSKKLCSHLPQAQFEYNSMSFGYAVSSLDVMAMNSSHNISLLKSIYQHPHLYSILYSSFRPSNKGSLYKVPFLNESIVHYPWNDYDQEMLRKCANQLVHFGFSLKAKEVHLLTKVSSPAFASFKDYSAWSEKKLCINELKLSSVHMMGTCPMGEDLNRCIVDSYGRLHGHDNIFIQDSSILCNAPGVNPQAIIGTIVMRNIDFLTKMRFL